MKEQIRQRALQLGFDDCRFTTAQPPNHAEEFKQWLGERRHGEMAYMERNAPKRVDPQLVLPGVSAFATVGITSVLTNNTTAPRMSRIRFTVFFSLLERLERDIFMSALSAMKSF